MVLQSHNETASKQRPRICKLSVGLPNQDNNGLVKTKKGLLAALSERLIILIRGVVHHPTIYNSLCTFFNPPTGLPCRGHGSQIGCTTCFLAIRFISNSFQLQSVAGDRLHNHQNSSFQHSLGVACRSSIRDEQFPGSLQIVLFSALHS